MKQLIIIGVGLLFLFLLACNNNAKSSDDNKNTPPTENTLNATFSSIQKNVFSKSCAFSTCHGGSVSPTLSSGSAYNNLVNKQSRQNASMLLVKPGDSAHSYLMKKLKGEGTSRMPKNGAALSTAIIDTVASWIDRGAKNN